MHTGDGYIVRQCLNGETEAFGLLVDRYKTSIYALVYAKVGNFADAEDLTQETFINAFERLGTLKCYDNFFAWLYSIALNRCKNFYRTLSRRRDRDYLEDQDPYLLLRRQDMAAHEKKTRYAPLYDALAELPEMYRQVLTLYYMAGMGGKEIAQTLRISPNTVNQRLMRARAKLKAALSPDTVGKEMNAMMSATFSEMKLRPGFTFYVVEAIKRTRIQTAPPKHALPFGVSAAVGLIAILLSLTTPYSPLYPIGEWIGSALPSRTQVVEKSVIPVDAVNVAQITILSNDSGKKDFGQKPKPEPMKFFGGGKWEKKGDMPTARGGTTAEIVKDKIYVIGGFDGVRAMSTVLEYDPIADTWTQKADMPTARFDHAACVVDGKIYVIGGYNRALAKVFSTVEAYDPARDMWTKHPDMPTARYVNSAGVVNGMIYVCGGGLIGDVNDAPTRVVERYNPITGKWTKEADMLSGRQEFSVAVLGGKIYAFGGGTILGNIQSTVEVLDIGTQSVTPAGKLPTTWGEVKAAQ